MAPTKNDGGGRKGKGKAPKKTAPKTAAEKRQNRKDQKKLLKEATTVEVGKPNKKCVYSFIKIHL